jgi:hypothetical protein
VLAAMGMVLMWWEERAHRHRVFLTGLLIFSILAICPGLYFREHYFILLLPALVLLAGVAVSRGIHLVRHEKSVEVLLALPILGMFVVGMVYAVVEHGAVWFDSSPEQACRRIYKGQFFAESVEVGRYLRDHSAEKARIAVLGSEPQIYFYARRHSATGYIYMYPLMEPHRYSVRMQAEMIGELEAARPEYVVFVSLEWSWGFRPTSERRLLDWWTGYRLNYDLVGIVDRSADEQPIYKWEGAVAGYQPGSPQHVLVFKRRN